MKEDIENIAINTAHNLSDITEIKARIESMEENMVTKSDIKPILTLIGSYEIRAKNTEDTLMQDHRPRIISLEKEVFA